jgi:hypothetical protein
MFHGKEKQPMTETRTASACPNAHNRSLGCLGLFIFPAKFFNIMVCCKTLINDHHP